MDDKQIQAARAMVRPLAQFVAQFAESARRSNPAMSELGRQVRASIKTGVRLPISRELALEYGLVEPTDAERAEQERLAVKAVQERAERKAKILAARAQLAAVVEEPARMILDLHYERDGECQGCEFDGPEAEPPAWPCTTTVTIARHYGIEIPT